MFSVNFRCTNICIMGVLEGEEREQEVETCLKNNDRKLPYRGEGNRHTSPAHAERVPYK